MNSLNLPKRPARLQTRLKKAQIPRPHSARGCCAKLQVHEENIRFGLLAVIMIFYLLAGAVTFHLLEFQQETRDREQYAAAYAQFQSYYPNVNVSDLNDVLYAHGNATVIGLFYERRRWDMPGAFYFVGTLVSTIGFGMTAPKTTTGKMFVILYGFFGCAGAILFFNLFLERVVTLFANILRRFHKIHWYRRKWTRSPSGRKVPSIHVSDENDAEQDLWKPSVYGVHACLLTMTSALILTASLVYSYRENWPLVDSIYYCFVAFATIGFGDYVASQQSLSSPNPEWALLYRIANAIFLMLGCCCVYSLFNVTSITIRQLLNWIIQHLDLRCNTTLSLPRCPCYCSTCIRPKAKRPYLGLGLSQPLDNADPDISDDSRRSSNTSRCSLKEFLAHNQNSIVQMQRHLLATAGIKQEIPTSTNAISANAVGPLAILTEKFGDY